MFERPSTAAPRLWRILGLVAAASGFAAPVPAMTPDAAQSSLDPPLLWQAEAAGGETEQQGEAGPPIGGLLDAEVPEVALLTGLGLIEGYVRAGMDLAAAGESAHAAVRAGRPGAELYEELEPMLVARDLLSFEAELEALEQVARAGGSAEDVLAAYEVLLARIGELRDAVVAEPAERFAAIAAILRAAADHYGTGVRDGRLTDPEAYQDARGFAAVALERAKALAQSTDATVATAAEAILAALAEADTIFPALSPEDGLPETGADLLRAAAARAEIAGLSTR